MRPQPHYVEAERYQVTWWPGEKAEDDINSQSTKGSLQFSFLYKLGVRSLANASRAKQFNPLNPPGVGWVPLPQTNMAAVVGRAWSVVRGRSCVVVRGRACVVGHAWSVMRGRSCVVGHAW